MARWLSDLLQDTAFAARTIRKQPGFATLAVLSAALGIGACSLLFGVANFALFRPLSIRQPSRLASISGRELQKGRVGRSLAYPDFEDLRQAASFQGMTAFYPFMPASISGNGEPQRYWGTIATADYFDVVRPGFALGRGFDAARDGRKGEAPVVVLSYALMGLLISTVGIYGVISFSVARQTRDIGIRIALGARRGQVLGRVMRQGLTLTLAGSAMGLGVAWALSRTAASLLYGVSATDTLTFLAVPILLLLLATVACLVPARRAAALDPIRALRCE